MPPTITIEARAAHLDEALRDAIVIAKLVRNPVVLDFNDTLVPVFQYSTVEDRTALYFAMRG